MAPYTGKGDKGETTLPGVCSLSKTSPRVAALGDVDELNSLLGVCKTFCTTLENPALLDRLQQLLFRVQAEVASPEVRKKSDMKTISQADVRWMEHAIGGCEKKIGRAHV